MSRKEKFEPVRDAATDITYASYEDFTRAKRMQFTADGITYASHGDYMKATVTYNGKDVEIASLKNKVRDLEGKVAESGKSDNSKKAEIAKYRKELERFYLEAIGNANTVKQVETVTGRYAKSSLCFDQMAPILRDIMCVHLFAKTPQKFNGTSIQQAAATKIKRINRRDAEEVCDMLDTQTDRNCYASSMAAMIEGIAGIEVDRVKILDAKDSGLDAWNVLLSLLSAYNVKHDDVLGGK